MIVCEIFLFDQLYSTSKYKFNIDDVECTIYKVKFTTIVSIEYILLWAV